MTVGCYDNNPLENYFVENRDFFINNVNTFIRCRVKLEGQPTTTLQIIGNVVERSLELLRIDTEEPVQTINFGSTYYGTDLTQSFLIYNNGPAIAHFVVILEEGGEGQEVVCTMYSVQYMLKLNFTEVVIH